MNQENVRRVLLLLFVALVGLGVYAANHSENTITDRKVTRIEAASPCLKDAKSTACRRSFSRAIETITPDQVCDLFAVIHVVPAECRRIAERRTEAKEVVPSGNTPSSQPGPHHGGSPGSPQGGNPPASGGSTASPVPVPTEQPPVSEPGASLVPEVVESVGGLVCHLSPSGVPICP